MKPQTKNRHLHTLEEIKGYTIQASDGKIGHIKDVVFVDSDWAIRYLIIDTSNWLPGKKVIIPIAWIEQVDWDNKEAKVSITSKQVEESPSLDEMNTLDREFEERLFNHYQRPGYWIKESAVDEASWESFPASDPPAKW